MSHFYARIPTSARRTIATARGHKSTGITIEAASWAGAIQVQVWHDTKTNTDQFMVQQIPWHGQGTHELMAVGELGKPKDKVA